MSFRDIPDDITPTTYLTPSNSADLANAHGCMGVVAGGAGVIQVTTLRNTIGLITVAAGVPFPLRITRVWSTNTTATNITALYSQL